MRFSTIVLGCVLLGILGGTCVPLIDETTRTAAPGNLLAVSIKKPDADRRVAPGAEVVIDWAAANVTGEAGVLSLLVESRRDLLRTVLLADVAVGSQGASGTYSWDTTGFSGPYVIYGRLVTASRTVEERATGIITVDTAPLFVFEEPKSNVTFTLGQSPVKPVNLAWTGRDENAAYRVGLDRDTDHGAFEDDPNGTGRNEIILTTGTITTAQSDGSFSFEGKDRSGRDVPEGTYFIFAIVNDGVNPDLVVEAQGRLTVNKVEPNQPAAPLEVTKPAEDTTFLTTTATLQIEVKVSEKQDALVDIKIDTDDNHQNGNEITLLAQRLVSAGGEPVVFDWTGVDSAGNPVPDGIYKVFAVSSLGTGSPRTDDAPGLVFRRSSVDQPLIAALEPATRKTIEPGNFVTIKWRDDDPNNPTPAKVFVFVDKDGDFATTGDQFAILTNREAGPDGVQDTFTWQVPAGLLEVGKEYTVICTIDRDGVAPPDGISSAPGRLFVKDPTSP